MGALAEIVRVLGEPKGFVEKCGEMLAILAREVGADLATLREPDSSFTSMNLIAEYKSEESTDVDLPFSVPLRSIFETEAKPFGVGDYSKWPSPVQAYLKNGPRAGMVAPIYHDGVLTGFLGFGSRDLNKFDEQSANLLSTISDIVGVLIQNARLLELREIESDMGRILRSPLELSAVFESFSVEVKKVINFDRIGIYSTDDQNHTIENQFLKGAPVPGFTPGPGTEYRGSLIGASVETGEPVMFNLEDWPAVKDRYPAMAPLLDRGFVAFMAVPLKSGDKVVGSFGLSCKSGKYTSNDLVHAGRMANLIAGSLDGLKSRQEQAKSQLERLESEERFRQIAESIGGVFWLVDLKPRRLAYASPNFEEIFLMPVEDVYGDFDRWFRSVHQEDLARVQEASAQVPETGEIDVEYRTVDEDGTIRWIKSRGFPVKDESGKLTRMSGISEDVTPQKLELQRLTEASRLLSVGELASGVAHEINNPLTVIKLSSEALKESNLPESAVHDLEIISNQTERIADIVGEMGFLSRRSPMIISNISATEFLERCLALKKHDFRINNISVASQVQTGLQEINIDERLMTQVMVNIFTNAEQACNSANGRGHISVTVRKSEGLIKFAISDDGPGIPSEILSQVFDPFFTTKDKAGGTGLGLSVSYSIVAQLGGNLWAESNGVSGTTFHIDIPAASHDQVDALAEPLSRGDQASQTQRAGRILVVDDEPDLRRILVRVLEGDSYIVDQATEGEEAWDMLKEQEYDCILLDLRMAGISGQELFQRISSSDSSQAEKVVFLTGDGGNPSTNMFLESLHNTVLEKPVSIDQLKRTLRESIK